MWLRQCLCISLTMWLVATNLLCTCCLLCTPLLLLLSSTPLYSSPLLSSCFFFATSTTSLLLLSITSDCPICSSGSKDIKHMMFLQCHVAFSGKQLLLFFAKSPLSSIFSTFPILYVWEAAAACFYTFFSLCLLSSCCFFAKSSLSSPLLCFANDEIV